MPRNEDETYLIYDMRICKEWGCHNTGNSNPPLNLVLPGSGSQDQRSTPKVGGRGRSPPLPIYKTRRIKNICKHCILFTPSHNHEKVETFRVNSEKCYGAQIITCVTDLNQISSLCMDKTATGQTGFTQLLPYNFYNNLYNHFIPISKNKYHTYLPLSCRYVTGSKLISINR